MSANNNRFYLCSPEIALNDLCILAPPTSAAQVRRATVRDVVENEGRNLRFISMKFFFLN